MTVRGARVPGKWRAAALYTVLTLLLAYPLSVTAHRTLPADDPDATSLHVDARVEQPRVRASAAVDLRREYLLSIPQLARVFRKSHRQRLVRGAGAVAHRQSGARRECRLAAVGRAVRAWRVRARTPRRSERGRRRDHGTHLRVFTATLSPLQSDSSHRGPVDSVRAGFASCVSGWWTETRSPAGGLVFHASGAGQRPRRRLSGRCDPAHARRIDSRSANLFFWRSACAISASSACCCSCRPCS